VFGVLCLAIDRIDLYKHVYCHSELCFRVLGSSGAAATPGNLFGADARWVPTQLRTEIYMHGLIRRTSADNRKWNERPSAGIIRPDAVATGRDALQDALLRDPGMHVQLTA
jgi:hypothetical protein